MQIAQAQAPFYSFDYQPIKRLFFDVGVDGFEPPTLCL